MVRKFLMIGIVSLLLASCVSEQGVDPYFARFLEQDFAILARTKELLATEARWDRNGEQTCPQNAEKWSLFCALMQASRDVAGDFELRRPALTEVRGAIKDVTGKNFDRRLLDFNNDSATTFQDVRAVLDRAGKRLAASRG